MGAASGGGGKNSSPLVGTGTAEAGASIKIDTITAENPSKIGGNVSEYRDAPYWYSNEITLSEETVRVMKEVMKQHMSVVEANRKDSTFVKGKPWPATLSTNSAVEDFGKDSRYMTELHKQFIESVAKAIGIPAGEEYKVTKEVIEQNSDILLQSPKMQLLIKNMMDYEQLALQLTTGQELKQGAGFMGLNSVRRFVERLKTHTVPGQKSTTGLTPGSTSMSAQDYAVYVDSVVKHITGDGYRIQANTELVDPLYTRQARVNFDKAREIVRKKMGLGGGTTGDEGDQIAIFAESMLADSAPGNVIKDKNLAQLEKRLLELSFARTDMLAATGVNSLDVLRERMNLIKNSIVTGWPEISNLSKESLHFSHETEGDVLTSIRASTAEYAAQAAIDLKNKFEKEKLKADEAKFMSGAKAAAEALSSAPAESNRQYSEAEKQEKRDRIEVAKLYKEAVEKDKDHEDKIRTAETEMNNVDGEIKIWNTTFAAKATLIDSSHFPTGSDTLDLLANPDNSRGYIAKTEKDIVDLETGNTTDLETAKLKEKEDQVDNQEAIDRLKQIYDEKLQKKINYEKRIQEHNTRISKETAERESNVNLFAKLSAQIASFEDALTDEEAKLEKDPKNNKLKGNVDTVRAKLKKASEMLGQQPIVIDQYDFSIASEKSAITLLEGQITALDVPAAENNWKTADVAEKKRVAKSETTIAEMERQGQAKVAELRAKKQKAEELVEKKSSPDGMTGKELYEAKNNARLKKETEVQRRETTRINFAGRISSFKNASGTPYNLKDIAGAPDTAILIEAISKETDHLNIPLKDVAELSAYVAKLQTELAAMEAQKGSVHELKVAELKREQAVFALRIIDQLAPATTQTSSDLLKRINMADDASKDWHGDVWTEYLADMDINPAVTKENKIAYPPVLIKIYKVIGGEDIFLPTNRKELQKIMSVYSPDQVVNDLKAQNPTILAALNARGGSIQGLFKNTGTTPNVDGVALAQSVTADNIRKIMKNYLDRIRMTSNDALTAAERTDNIVLEKVTPDEKTFMAGLKASAAYGLIYTQAYNEIPFAIDDVDLARRLKKTFAAIAPPGTTDGEWRYMAQEIMKDRARQYGDSMP